MIRKRKGTEIWLLPIPTCDLLVLALLPACLMTSLTLLVYHRPFLKNVFELEEELEFQLLNNQGKITFHFQVNTSLQPLILTLTILSTLVIPQEYWF